jgi:hypothetical protein
MQLAPLLIFAALRAEGDDWAGRSAAEVAASAEAAFTEGVRHRDQPALARRKFQVASNGFHELYRRGARNPKLFCNLGNAYLLADDLPHAIQAYQRGLRLAPGSRELAIGLRAARSHVVYPTGSELGRLPADAQVPYLSLAVGEWLFAGAVLFYSAACISFTRWLMTRRRALIAAGGVALAIAASCTALAVHGSPTERPLVIINQDGVLLRRGDSSRYPPRFETPLNRGVEARLLVDHVNWIQIELAGGDVGWVPRENVLLEEGDHPPST